MMYGESEGNQWKFQCSQWNFLSERSFIGEARATCNTFKKDEMFSLSAEADLSVYHNMLCLTIGNQNILFHKCRAFRFSINCK